MKIIKSLVRKIMLSRIGAPITLSILTRAYIKQPLWLHVGGPKTASTTLQEDIFPLHPQIGYFGREDNSYKPQTGSVHIVMRVFVVIWYSALSPLVPFPKKILSRRRGSVDGVLSRILKPSGTKLYLSSHEALSCIRASNKPINLPEIVRKKTRVLYIVRNEVEQLHSLWLALLSSVIFSRVFRPPFSTADEFAEMVNSLFPATEKWKDFNWTIDAAQTNVHAPRTLIEKTLPRWGHEIHVLPYELFAEEPKTYLDKISGLMDIDPKITWRLYKDAGTNKKLQKLGPKTMPHFSGRMAMAMRQRGLEFCRNFKHERRLYDADWKLFFRTADKYAATLPQQPRKAFTDTLMKIKNNWSGDSALEIYKLATEPTFSNWLRGGEKVKPEFSKKTLERLRKIRAPQNRWLAKKFDLDLERYGYAM